MIGIEQFIVASSSDEAIKNNAKKDIKYLTIVTNYCNNLLLMKELQYLESGLRTFLFFMSGKPRARIQDFKNNLCLKNSMYNV